MPLVGLDILPQPRDWEVQRGAWRGNCLEIDPGLVAHAQLLLSPDFTLDAGRLVLLTFSGYFGGGADYFIHIVEGRRRRRVHSRLFEALEGEARLSLAFRPRKSGSFRVILEHEDHPKRSKPTITAPAIVVQAVGAGAVGKGRLAELGDIAGDGDDAGYLPHWNGMQRFIHRRCRASRWFNNVVAAIEMRLGREEILSLPQYMGLCPTGQCNALCDFCSVTINRTGIIKKQLPYQRLEGFLEPVSNTIQMYGIEGNGEPTLYTHFPELVERLTRAGGTAYLITNGSRLQLSDVPLLMALESVNFSLNAGTAATHRRVMKLKNFDEIVVIIQALARDRGRWDDVTLPSPTIYASFVVTDDNIHETQDFLRFAEKELAIDVAHVRPLSELGNDVGLVEDVRRIVPYESDIKDMIDAVREYMHDVSGTTEIRIAPETFRSFRPDPVGRVVMPRGFEGRLLAPRRGDWHASRPGVVAIWHLNEAQIVMPAVEGELLRSQPVAVEPERQLQFKAGIRVSGGPVRLLIENEEGAVVAEAVIADTDGRSIPVELQVSTDRAHALSFVLAGQGRSSTMHIDFERLRTPAPYVSTEFSIPPERRWERYSGDADIEWTQNTVRVRSITGGRPYLLKSYSIPCARNSTIEIPLEVEVTAGAIEVGVLDEAGAYLQSFHFAGGRASSRVFFHSGINDSVQLVLSARPDQPVAATVHWRRPRLIPDEENDEAPSPLPEAAEWGACVQDVRVERRAGGLSLSWQGEGSPYLLKSNKVRCRPDRAVTAQMAVQVEAGCLCIGVLDGSGATWLDTRLLREGTHRIDLGFHSRQCDGVFLVVSAFEGIPVTGTVDLSDGGFLASAPDQSIRGIAAAPPLAAVAGSDADRGPVKSDVATLAAASLPIEAALRRNEGESRQQAVGNVGGEVGTQRYLEPAIQRDPVSATLPADYPSVVIAVATPLRSGADRRTDVLPGAVMAVATVAALSTHDDVPHTHKRGRGEPRTSKPTERRSGPRYYCQKPWTDLHNFTVDGRMDVCCIATGASQERYQLGNLTRQTFQEIWNGPKMREFRRTVNSDEKLPPCARCPMSYAYQGLWFDPYYTRVRVLEVFKKLRLAKLRLAWLGNSCASLIERIVFTGFNRETRWMN